MFLGDNDTTLTGRDAILLAATTNSCPDFVPPAIANTAGKKCIVFAVTPKTLDMNDGLVFKRPAD
jgi:hypothetical protein